MAGCRAARSCSARRTSPISRRRALTRARCRGRCCADVGCGHVIVGHSERRALYGETDAVVATKFKAAQAARPRADRLRRRNARATRGGRDALRSSSGNWRPCVDVGRRARVRQGRHRLRARMGDRHGTHGDTRASAGGPRLHPRHDRGAGCYNCGRFKHPVRRQRQRRQRPKPVRDGRTSTAGS